MKENPENHKLSLGDRQSKIVKKKQAFLRCLFFNYRNKSIISFNTFAIFKKYLHTISMLCKNLKECLVFFLLRLRGSISSPPLVRE